MPSQTCPQRLDNPNQATTPLIRNCLACLGVALLALQLLLCERVSLNDFRFAALCAGVLGFLIWPRRNSLSLESGPVSTLIGFGLLAFFLVRGSGQTGKFFATIAPIFWGVGFALVASGFTGLRQYWKEGMILGAIVATPFVDTLALDLLGVDLAPVTARVTASLLRLGGWDASSRDVLVGLPKAWIVVSQGCSGLKTMYFLGGFSILVLLMFPVPGWSRKIIIVLTAILVGFFVNAVRVALLALLAGPEYQRVFAFLHVQQGAMLFEIIAIVVFVALFYFAIPVRRAKKSPPGPASR